MKTLSSKELVSTDGGCIPQEFSKLYNYFFYSTSELTCLTKATVTQTLTKDFSSLVTALKC